MIVLHGTSADNLKSIKKNGLQISNSGQNWNCSEDYIFVWHTADMSAWLNEDSSKEEHWQAAMARAGESANFALIQQHKNCRRIIVVLDIEEERLLPDDSAEHMDGAYMIAEDVAPEHIIAIYRDNESLLPALPYFLSFDHPLLMEYATNSNLSRLEEVMQNTVQDKNYEIGEVLDEYVFEMELIYETNAHKNIIDMFRFSREEDINYGY